MSRSTGLWKGKSDNTPVPPRIRVRQFERDGGKCQCGCGTAIRPGDKWETDHKVAIILGGANDESNLQTLLAKHHASKTKADVAEKSKNYRVRAKHLGLLPKRQKIASRGFAKAPAQHTATRPIEKRGQP